MTLSATGRAVAALRGHADTLLAFCDHPPTIPCATCAARARDLRSIADGLLQEHQKLCRAYALANLCRLAEERAAGHRVEPDGPGEMEQAEAAGWDPEDNT